jgi:hypothetical protein
VSHSKPLTLESTSEHPYATGEIWSPFPDGGSYALRRPSLGEPVGTECDRLALALIWADKLIVEPEPGEIYRKDGRRAERLSPYMYGLVRVSRGHNAMAHRVIWTFVHGLIPGRSTIATSCAGIID